MIGKKSDISVKNPTYQWLEVDAQMEFYCFTPIILLCVLFSFGENKDRLQIGKWRLVFFLAHTDCKAEKFLKNTNRIGLANLYRKREDFIQQK